MVKVAVAGALGRMGRATCTALATERDLRVVGGFARTQAGQPLAQQIGIAGSCGQLYADIATLCDAAKPDVLVDFTTYPMTLDVARTALEHGVAVVIGATGWTPEDRTALAALCDRSGVPACIVPNFALGAVLMMRFAEQAARYFPTVEIVELHHDKKRDAPSGTARLTADRIVKAGGPADVPIHSVRLRGLVAHQEVLFGGTGEVLTIRHDSLARESFMAGVVLAVRGIRGRTGLTVGLDAFLDGV
jgi:4-hydroxy-tetrahydrodipicolinate reductase